jgi:hypothetical protein
MNSQGKTYGYVTSHRGMSSMTRVMAVPCFLIFAGLTVNLTALFCFSDQDSFFSLTNKSGFDASGSGKIAQIIGAAVVLCGVIIALYKFFSRHQSDNNHNQAINEFYNTKQQPGLEEGVRLFPKHTPPLPTYEYSNNDQGESSDEDDSDAAHSYGDLMPPRTPKIVYS